MNNLVKSDADTVYVSVPRPDKKVEDMLAVLMSGSHREAGALQVLRLPDEDQRGTLLARLNYLSKSMHADADKIGLLVAQMLRGYRARSTGEDSGMRMAQDVKLFMRELMMPPAVPTWAVALVCSSIRFGRMEGVKPGSEPPTALLRRLCDQKAWSTRAEIATIGGVLKAKKWLPELTEAQRAEVGGKMRALHGELAERLRVVDEAPLSVASMIDLAGGMENWNMIPDAERRRADRMETAKSIGKEADRALAGFYAHVDEMADEQASKRQKRSRTKPSR